MLSDRSELSRSAPEFDALVARIHQNLRKERRARKWRAGAAARHRAMLVMLVLFAPLAAGLYLAGLW
jgi:hypothetical protein